jgi:hypothetical protein
MTSATGSARPAPSTTSASYSKRPATTRPPPPLAGPDPVR